MNPNEITPQDHAAEEIPSIASLPDANDSIATPPPFPSGEQSEAATIPADSPLITMATSVASVSPLAADYAETGYTPVFSGATRTVIYVVCGILGLLGAACAVVSYTTGGPAWLTVASVILGFIAPYVANMFGVAYNPLKMASR